VLPTTRSGRAGRHGLTAATDHPRVPDHRPAASRVITPGVASDTHPSPHLNHPTRQPARPLPTATNTTPRPTDPRSTPHLTPPHHPPRPLPPTNHNTTPRVSTPPPQRPRIAMRGSPRCPQGAHPPTPITYTPTPPTPTHCNVRASRTNNHPPSPLPRARRTTHVRLPSGGAARLVPRDRRHLRVLAPR
jgi:hypothetical protein